MPKVIARSVFVFLFASLASLSAVAQQRPLITEDVEVVKPGSVRLEFGFDFTQQKKYPVSGLQGDLSRLGVASVTFGLAPNVEVEVGGVIHNSLAISRRGASAIPLDLKNINSTSDVGDFFIATKIKARNETDHIPAIGLRFGVQLPNSNQARGLGAKSNQLFHDCTRQQNRRQVSRFRQSRPGNPDSADTVIYPKRLDAVRPFGCLSAQ